MSFGNDNPYKFVVSSLVDEPTRNKVLDYANHETAGNMASAGRKLIEIALEYLDRTNGLEPSPMARLEALQRKAEQKEERCAKIYDAYSRLQFVPDKEIERTLIEAAKEEGIEWPPKSINLAETLPKYKNILNHLKLNNNQLTIRELQRSMRLDKNELIDRLAFLVESKKITVDDMYYGYTCNVFIYQEEHRNGNNNGHSDSEI